MWNNHVECIGIEQINNGYIVAACYVNEEGEECYRKTYCSTLNDVFNAIKNEFNGGTQ